MRLATSVSGRDASVNQRVHHSLGNQSVGQSIIGGSCRWEMESSGGKEEMTYGLQYVACAKRTCICFLVTGLPHK